MNDTNDSRIEKLLKAILGQEVQLEPRESRVERLLYAILTGGSHDEPTLSEMEDILLCILHGERYDGQTNSRINALLKVKANGGSYDEPRLSRIEELIYEWINGGDISTYTGTLPATLQTVAGFLESYKIWGNPTGCGERTSNLFDESTIEVGGLSPSTGAEITNSARRRSGFILVESSTDYGLSREITSSGSHFWVIAYDESKNIVTDATTFETFSGVLIKGNELTDSQWTFATTPTTRYIRWYVTYNNSYKNIMLNLGSAPLPYEPYGYKLPILSDSTENDIYIGDTQLAKDEYVDSETGKIYRYVDGTLTPTDPPAPLPLIPTAAGETTISYGGAGVQPEKVELKYRK